MKFEYIPQLTSVGSYQVNVPLRYLKDSIKKYIDEYDLQLNPDFQRGYVWTVEQQIKYVNFLLRGGKSANVIYLNHPGWMGTFRGEFVCVDGLQRVTACLRFLNNEIRSFGFFYHEYVDKIPLEVELTVNVNNLKTKKEVLQWYLEMNSGGTMHTVEQLNMVRELLRYVEN